MSVCPWRSNLARSDPSLAMTSARRASRRSKMVMTRRSKSAMRNCVRRRALYYTTDLADLANCNVYIVTVPTPIDEHKRPDLSPLIKASEAIGKVLKKGDIVIYESTVYPGATEEDCAPVLESRVGTEVQRRLLCGLQPRTHQSRRQAASGLHDQKGHLRLHAGSRRTDRSSSTARSLSPAPTRRRASRWLKPPR